MMFGVTQTNLKRTAGAALTSLPLLLIVGCGGPDETANTVTNTTTTTTTTNVAPLPGNAAAAAPAPAGNVVPPAAAPAVAAPKKVVPAATPVPPPPTPVPATAALTVQAQVIQASKVPPPASSSEKDALTYVKYKVLKVEQGTYAKPTILVVHYGMRDRKLAPAASYKPGQKVKLVLDEYSKHPELDAMSVYDDIGDLELTAYWGG